MLGFGKKKKREPQSSKLPIWIWGRDYLQPGDCHVRTVNALIAAGIAPGSRKAMDGKLDHNEDAMGLIALEDGLCLLLADSHFGKLAAEVALEQFADEFAATSGSMEERLFLSVLGVDRAIRDAKSKVSDGIHLGCATTFVAAWIHEDQLIWASLGDSFLWHIRDGQAHLENDRTANFLGERRPLLEAFQEVLEDQQILKPSSDPPDAFWWRMSQLNRSVRGLKTSYDSQAQILEDLREFVSDPASLESLCKAWSPLQIAAKSVLPEWGGRRLRSGDRILMATDGVEEPASLVPMEKMLQLAGNQERTPSQTVDRILAACHGRRGGGDNLMCWVLEII